MSQHRVQPALPIKKRSFAVCCQTKQQNGYSHHNKMNVIGFRVPCLKISQKEAKERAEIHSNYILHKGRKFWYIKLLVKVTGKCSRTNLVCFPLKAFYLTLYNCRPNMIYLKTSKLNRNIFLLLCKNII